MKPNPRHRESPLLDAGEIADILAVKIETVNRWARQGRIPSIDISPRVRRFRMSDILEAIESPSEEGHRP